MKRLIVFTLLLGAGACERSLLHPLPDPLPANDQVGNGACAAGLAPSDLRAEVLADRVELTWSDNADGTLAFVVERRDTGGFEDWTVAQEETTYSDDRELVRDTVLGYRVRAEGDDCVTAASESVDVLTFPAPPADVEVTGAADSITLTWTDTNDNETAYRVEVVGTDDVETLPAGAESYTDDDLTRDVVQTYRLVAVNDSGEAFVEVDGGTTPNAPTGLTVTAVNAGELRLEWVDTNDNESGYRVYRTEDGTTTQLGDVAADVTSYSDTDVSSGDALTYDVVAFNPGGESEAATAQGVTPCEASAKPVVDNFTTGYSDDAHALPYVSLEWSATTVTDYSWRVERDGGSGYSALTTVTNSSALAYTDAAVVSDSLYSYRIVASKGACEIGSDAASITGPPLPVPSTDVTVSAAATDTVDVTWTDNNANETGYEVWLYDGANWALQTTTVADATSAEVDMQAADTEVLVAVIGRAAGYVTRANLDAFGASGWTLPAAPDDLMVSGAGTDYIELSWEASPNNRAARILRDGVEVATDAQNVFIDDGLVEGQTYGYTVTIVGPGGESAAAEVSERTRISPQLAWDDPVWDTADCRIELPGAAAFDDGKGALYQSAFADITPDDAFASPSANDVGVVVRPVSLDELDTVFDTTLTVSWTVADSFGVESTLSQDVQIVLASPVFLNPGDVDQRQPGAGVQPLVDTADNLGCIDRCVGRLASVSAGTDSTCAVVEDGGLYCWGNDDDGQLGNGSAGGGGVTEAPLPVCGDDAVDCGFFLTDIVQVGVGAGFACALDSSGQTHCWGLNTVGQLGDSTGTSPREVPVGTQGGVVGLAVGRDHACAVYDETLTGLVRCWGSDNRGQLGDPDFTAAYSRDARFVCAPGNASCPDTQALSGVLSLAAGDRHTCALRGDDKVLCWGNSQFGQAGTDATTVQDVATIIGCGGGPCDASNDLTNIVQVAAGGDHSCALDSAGYVWCWGQAGKVGNSSVPDDTHTPAGVCAGGLVGCANPLDDVQTIASGGPFTCAIQSGGHVWCWGGGNIGELPRQLCEGGFQQECTGATTNDEPVLAVAVDPGLNHICAARPDGRVRCWGINYDGQLGDPGLGSVGPDRSTDACADAEIPCPPLAGAHRTCGTVSVQEVTP